MKTFKMYDAYIQIVLIVVVSILSIIQPSQYFLLSYFVVGTVQIISCCTHLLKGWNFNTIHARRYYHWMLIVILIAAAFCFIFNEIIVFYGYFLLLFTPLMAIYYAVICVHELYSINQRPLALLK